MCIVGKAANSKRNSNYPLVRCMATIAMRWHHKSRVTTTVSAVNSQSDVSVTTIVVEIVVMVVVVVAMLVFGAWLVCATRCHAVSAWRIGSRCKHSCDFPPRQLQPVFVLSGARQHLQLIGRGRRGIGRDT